MTLSLVLRGLRLGKARFACAALGVAAAVGAVVFMNSLRASNDAQAPALARRAAAPWQSWRTTGVRTPGGRVPGARPRQGGGAPGAKQEGAEPPQADLSISVVGMTVDYRPGGHVMQGPPLRCVIAPISGASCPYSNARLSEGRWPDPDSETPEVVAFPSGLTRGSFDRAPAIGEVLKFVGAAGTSTATLVGYLDGVRVLPGWPDVFANAVAFGGLAAERHGTLELWRDAVGGRGVANADSAAPSFQTDAGRNFGRAESLLLWAAALTALCLLVNSLFLSIEANRRQIAVLRTVGLTRGGVVRLVLAESLLATAVGVAVGCAAALACLRVYVGLDSEMFPVGPAISVPSIAGAALCALAVAVAATLLLLKPALSVRPLEAASDAPQISRRRAGMVVAFAFGFGSFVAVEVWGASLMKPFIPSPEWPDAIVSLLPGGIAPADIGRLRSIEGVARINELRPFQANFWPEEPQGRPGPGQGPGHCHNSLLLGSDHLPRFRFSEGTYEEARAALDAGACVITAMMSTGRGLHTGDVLRVVAFGRVHELPIAGVADLNWHMVTSRGLLRGLNGASGQTDGPAFVSTATLDQVRAGGRGGATHLWLDYDPAFLAGHGVFPAGRLVEDRIRLALGDPASATIRLHARDEIADGTLAHGSDIIGSMARIPFIFIAVLSFGFIAMLVASADASRMEFATLNAVGATRAQLSLRLFSEAVRTAALGIALGLVGGILAGFLTADASRLAMTMWTIPRCCVVPWRVIAAGAAVSVGFVVVVAIPASLLLIRRAMRIS